MAGNSHKPDRIKKPGDALKIVPTPKKLRPKNLTIGGRYFYGKIQL